MSQEVGTAEVVVLTVRMNYLRSIKNIRNNV